MEGPLSGLRLIELSGNTIGAFATGIFADFGAEVIRLEPTGGVPLRDAPAYPFLARGTKSVVADVRTAEGARIAKELLSTADVLVTTLRPSTLAAAGLDDASLAALNPRLVRTSVSGFPERGPYADVAGYEAVIYARTGFMHGFRDAVQPPRPVFIESPYASFAAAHLAIQGTLAALLERERSGIGQRVTTSLVEGAAVHDTWNWFLVMIANRFPDAFRRGPTFDADNTPTNGLALSLMPVLTSDGVWLSPTQFLPKLYPPYLAALGLPDLFGDPSWGLPMMLDQPERRRELQALIVQRAREKSLAEWRAICDRDHNVWTETFTVGNGVLDHPQFVHDQTPVTIDDPERGPVRQPGPMLLLRGTPAQLGTPAPALGQHDAILSAQSNPSDGTTTRGWVGGGRPATAGDPTSESGSANRPALEGIKILDLGMMFAGPFGATLLGELGATVYKIEPLTGDPIRNAQPFPEAAGVKVMQGKRSIAVDITKAEGTAIIHALARECDLCIVSFRPDVARRNHFDEDTLRTINPELVYVYAPGYAVDGPYAAKPAFAPTVGAAAGIARRNLGASLPDGPGLTNDEIKLHSRRIHGSNTVVHAQSDGFGALGVATALLLGLVIRERTGTAQVIESSMLRTNMHAMGEDAVDYPGRAPIPASDRELRGHHALYRLYDTAEGVLFLAAPKPKEWERLVTVLAATVDLRADVRFASTEARLSNDAALIDVLQAAMRTRSAREWEGLLVDAGVAGVVVDERVPEEVFQDPTFGGAWDMLREATHPIFDAHPRLAPLVRFSRSPGVVGNGCVAGQHTREVLRLLGYDDARIDELVAANVVATA